MGHRLSNIPSLSPSPSLSCYRSLRRLPCTRVQCCSVAKPPKIKILGVGGGGCSAVSEINANGLKGVDFLGMDMDPNRSHFRNIKLLDVIPGATTLKEDIQAAIDDTDLLVIVATMGGSTGSIIAPIVAEVAKDMGIFTIGVVSSPFSYEGTKTLSKAREGITNMFDNADNIILIRCDSLVDIIPRDTKLGDSFPIVNFVFHQTVDAVMTFELDEVKTLVEGCPLSIVGFGFSSKENTAIQVAAQAVKGTPIGSSIASASRIICRIQAGKKRSEREYLNVFETIAGLVAPSAKILWDVVEVADDWVLDVTMLATGSECPVRSVPEQRKIITKEKLLEFELTIYSDSISSTKPQGSEVRICDTIRCPVRSVPEQRKIITKEKLLEFELTIYSDSISSTKPQGSEVRICDTIRCPVRSVPEQRKIITKEKLLEFELTIYSDSISSTKPQDSEVRIRDTIRRS